MKKVGDADPGGVANLYRLGNWAGMAPFMGPVSPICAIPSGQALSRKAGKEKNPFRACHNILDVLDQQTTVIIRVVLQGGAIQQGDGTNEAEGKSI